MTLAQIEADLYRMLGFETSPATAVTTRLRAHVNETQRRILAMRGMSRLRRTIQTFASIASNSYAVLPQAAVRFYSIHDRTNGQVLSQVPMEWILEQDTNLNMTSSVPEVYAIVNYASPVARQPANASQLLVDSTSVSDTGTAYIEGLITDGYHRSASVTMTGTTAVNLGPATMIHVTKFYISATAVGVVTLVEDAEGGTVLSTIPIGKAFARYTQIFLWPQPTAAVTYHADVDLHIDDMANAGDEPYLPEEFHWLLTYGAILRETWRKEKKELWQRAETEYMRGIADLQAHMHRESGIVGYSRRRRFSQLGPYYEGGT